MSKKGRPQKKNYDAKKQFQELLHMVDYVYDITGEINATATELDLSTIKVKKLLITSGKLEYDETKQIQRLIAYGKSIIEIQEEIGLKKSSINSYLPYSKVPYKDSEVSANADRCDLYRKRKTAVAAIRDFDSLWQAIILFSGYSFKTATGVKFIYTVKGGELFISQKENSVTKESIEKAYWNVMDRRDEREGERPMYNRPKDLGDLFGVSYIYPLFYRFGLIDVPDKVKEEMKR